MTDGKTKKVTIEQTSKKLKLIMAIGYILLILGVAVDMATADRADRFVVTASWPSLISLTLVVMAVIVLGVVAAIQWCKRG